MIAVKYNGGMRPILKVKCGSALAAIPFASNDSDRSTMDVNSASWESNAVSHLSSQVEIHM